MFGTLLLDEDGDLIAAYEVGDDTLEYETIGIALGSQQVAQAASMRVSTRQSSVWFNVTAGIDYETLFYNTSRTDTVMNPIRSQMFMAELLATPGVSGVAGETAVTFTRTVRTLAIDLPCVNIDCDNSRVVPIVMGS